MATGDTTQVLLCLELGAETIRGTLADERGNEQPFWGWLELSGALDELRGALEERATTLPRSNESTASEENQPQEGQPTGQERSW